jgi:hypothetical protein
MAIALLPAYGRKYKTRNALLADWYAGKDFKIENGPYANIHDYPKLVEKYGTVLLLHGLNSYVATYPG